jgi:hypothetical protein
MLPLSCFLLEMQREVLLIGIILGSSNVDE